MIKYLPDTNVCTFCGRSPAPRYTMTVCAGDPAVSESWRREVLPVCVRCKRLSGLLTAKGERYYPGHGVGLFDSHLGQHERPADPAE